MREQVAALADLGAEQGGVNVDQILDHFEMAVQRHLGALALLIAEIGEAGGHEDGDKGQAVEEEALHRKGMRCQREMRDMRDVAAGVIW